MDIIERINTIGGAWGLLAASGWAVAYMLWKHHVKFLTSYDQVVRESLALTTRVQIFLEENTKLLREITHDRNKT